MGVVGMNGILRYLYGWWCAVGSGGADEGRGMMRMMEGRGWLRGREGRQKE